MICPKHLGFEFLQLASEASWAFTRVKQSMGKRVDVDGFMAFVQAFRETPKMKDVTWMHWSFHFQLI